MKAMILAAGRGLRLRPLTDACPKPLLPVGGEPLIESHLRALRQAGITEVIINTAWLAEQFPAALGNGERYGLSITYAWEGGTGLETGGGLLNALPLLGDAPFLLVNGDIHLALDFSTLALPEGDLAHLVVVDPPDGAGDFALDRHGRLHPAPDAGGGVTYAGVGVIAPTLFAGWRAAFAAHETGGTPPAFRLAPLLRHAMRRGRIGGRHHVGHWTDAGTPEALAALVQRFRTQPGTR